MESSHNCLSILLTLSLTILAGVVGYGVLYVFVVLALPFILR